MVLVYVVYLARYFVNLATGTLVTKKPKPELEAPIQQRIRLAAPTFDMRLWRNNVGAVHTVDNRFIRFGLCNDSEKISKELKSSDLIGITQYTIKPEDVGKTFGIFTSIEVKREGWTFKGTLREVAQLKWINLIKAFGGFAMFATKPEDLENVDKA